MAVFHLTKIDLWGPRGGSRRGSRGGGGHTLVGGGGGGTMTLGLFVKQILL